MGLPQLITIGASIGISLLQRKLMGRTKVAPIDRGRLDDIRLNGNGFGEFKPRGYGKFRVAGLLIDATNIVHTTTTTPGHGGGKGAPKPPTPDTINHIYTTSLDIFVCESLGTLSPDLKVTRIWENTNTIYDTSITTQGDNLYEAERPGNTLAGGATTVSDSTASGGVAASLPNNGSVQWNGVYGTGAQAVLEIYYASTVANSVQFTFTGTVTTTFTDTLHDTGGEYTVYRSAPFALNADFTNSVYVENLSSATLKVDYLIVRISGQATGVINPQLPTAPTDDPHDPLPKYGYFPQADTDGTTSAQVVAGGNANIRVYTGTETQGADSAFVAIHGADRTPAYKGLVHVVLDQYQVKDAILPNFSFEVDTGCYALTDIVTDIYGLTKTGPAKLSLSALSGLVLLPDEGFVVSSRDAAGNWLEQLKTVFQFDLPEVDGVVKAVLRGGASVATITADELRAHWDKDPAPDEEIIIIDTDPVLLPEFVELGYLDALNDYHQSIAQSRRLSGPFGDKQSVNVALILTGTHARQLSETILYQRHEESRTFKVSVGPKYQKLHPGDVLTIQATNATHAGRLETQDWQIMGPQGLELVRTRASIYDQSITGPNSGYVPPVIQFPGNCKLILIDTALLRPEDAGDGDSPVVYEAVCLTGSGVFRGAFVFKERPIDSGSFQLESPFDTQASIGVVSLGTAGTIDPSTWDNTTTFTVGFYLDTTLSAASASDAENNPELNLAAIGSMAAGWYLLQFKTATPGSASSPYNARYTISGLLWDRFGTGAPSAGSLVGLDFVILNSAIKPRSVEITDLGVTRKYRCAAAGQSVDEVVETVTFTLQGNSLKDPAPGVQSTQDAATGDWRFSFFPVETTDPETERIKVVIVGAARDPIIVRPASPRPCSLATTSASGTDYASPKPGSGYHSSADVPGNSITATSAYVRQIISAWRTVLSTTWETGLTASSPSGGISSIAFNGTDTPFSLELVITARTAASSPSLAITDTTGTVFSDTTGEASGTRYSVEFIDGKVKFYRNRSKYGSPFFTYEIPPDANIFPAEAFLNAGTSTSWKDIEIQDERAALNYTAEMQVADFGAVQSSLTIRACQQRVIQGQVIDGRVTEVTFP